MKGQVLHTGWCFISGEAAGEIWNWSLLRVKGKMLICVPALCCGWWNFNSGLVIIALQANAAKALENSANMLENASPGEAKKLSQNLINGVGPAVPQTPAKSKDAKADESAAPVNKTVRPRSYRRRGARSEVTEWEGGRGRGGGGGGVTTY